MTSACYLADEDFVLERAVADPLRGFRHQEVWRAVQILREIVESGAHTHVEARLDSVS